MDYLKLLFYGEPKLRIKIPFVYTCGCENCYNYKVYSWSEAMNLNFKCETNPRHNLLKI